MVAKSCRLDLLASLILPSSSLTPLPLLLCKPSSFLAYNFAITSCLVSLPAAAHMQPIPLAISSGYLSKPDCYCSPSLNPLLSLHGLREKNPKFLARHIRCSNIRFLLSLTSCSTSTCAPASKDTKLRGSPSGMCYLTSLGLGTRMFLVYRMLFPHFSPWETLFHLSTCSSKASCKVFSDRSIHLSLPPLYHQYPQHSPPDINHNNLASTYFHASIRLVRSGKEDVLSCCLGLWSP